MTAVSSLWLGIEPQYFTELGLQLGPDNMAEINITIFIRTFLPAIDIHYDVANVSKTAYNQTVCGLIWFNSKS